MAKHPLPPADFVGRQRELAEVERLIAVYPLAWVCGLPGFGKTTLALKVAASREGVAWFGAAAGATAASAARELCGQLGGEPLRSVAARGSDAIDAALSALDQRGALAVIDDAHEIADIEALAAAAVSRLGRGRLLIVSRHRIPSARALASVPELQLSGLEPHDVRALASFVGAQLGPGAAEAAVAATGGSPLLLRQRLRSQRPGEEDPLRSAVSALDEQHTLALAALWIAPRQATEADLTEAGAEPQAVQALARRLLADGRRVHALVGEALSATAPDVVARAIERWKAVAAARGWATASWLLAARSGDRCSLRALLPSSPALRAIGQAADELEALLAAKALLPVARLQLVETDLLIQLDRLAEAALALPPVAEAGDEAFHALLAADLAFRRGELKRAEELLPAAGGPRAVQVRAGLLQRSGEAAAAAHLLLETEAANAIERALLDVQASGALAATPRAPEAIPLLDRAVRAFESISDTPSAGYALSVRAQLARQMGDWRGAAATAQRALDLLPAGVGAATRAPLEMQLAVTLALLGEVSAALPRLQRGAEQAIEASLAEGCFTCIALIEAGEGNAEAAHAAISAARKLCSPSRRDEAGMLVLAEGILSDDAAHARSLLERCAAGPRPQAAALARGRLSRLAFEAGVPYAWDEPSGLARARALLLAHDATAAAHAAAAARAHWEDRGRKFETLEAIELQVTCALEADDVPLAVQLCTEREQVALGSGHELEAAYSRALSAACAVRQWPAPAAPKLPGALGAALEAFVERPWNPGVTHGSEGAWLRRLRAAVGLSRPGVLVLERGRLEVVAEPKPGAYGLLLDGRDGKARTGSGAELAPRPQQWGLLEALAIAAGRPVDREELFTRVWHQRFTSASHDAAVKVAVARLRRLLEKQLPEGAVEAVGSAYRFAPWLTVAYVPPLSPRG